MTEKASRERVIADRMTTKTRWLITVTVFVVVTSCLEIGVGTALNLRFGASLAAEMWLTEVVVKSIPAHQRAVLAQMGETTKAIERDPEVREALLRPDENDPQALVRAVERDYAVPAKYVWIARDAAGRMHTSDPRCAAAILTDETGPSTAWCAAEVAFVGYTAVDGDNRFFLGRRIDDDYAQSILQLSGAEVELTSADGVVLATTLRSLTGTSAFPGGGGPDAFAVVDGSLDAPYRGLPAASSDASWAWTKKGERAFRWYRYEATTDLPGAKPVRVAVAVPTSGMTQGTLYGALTMIVIAVVAVVLVLIVGRRVVGAFTRPLATIAAAADRVAHSSEPVEVEVGGDVEVASLAQSFNSMVRDLRASREKAIHAEKMAGIGQLAAGIGHEINTPSQYALDSTEYLADCIPKLVAIVARSRELAHHLPEPERRAYEEALHRAKLDRMERQLGEAVDATRDGLLRITKIVSAMKSFSHPSRSETASIDIGDAVDVTTTVCRNEWKYVADLAVDIAPDAAEVRAARDELHQVLLNLVVNAAHAIEERYEGAALGHIAITTRRAGPWVELSVADDGCGIAPEHQKRVFEPFFTTKEIGKGTGQGLAIVWGLVEKHGGTVDVSSTVGVGTTFRVRLPAVGDDVAAEKQRAA